jgi:hypothetical protein
VTTESRASPIRDSAGAPENIDFTRPKNGLEIQPRSDPSAGWAGYCYI